MSETASTIIKLLSSLVSPKTCVKYLSVAITLVLSWVYVGKYIETLKSNGVSISNQQTDIVILLVGVGFGGLIGFIIVYIFEKLVSSWQSRELAKKREKESEASKIAQTKSNEAYVEEFKLAIDHLRLSQVRTLRKLSKGRENIDFSEGENRNLGDNGYIQKISCSYGSTCITEINQLIKSYVTEHWKRDVESRIKRLYRENKYAKELLELLKVENANNTTPVNTKFFEILSVYGNTCLHGDYEQHPDNENSSDYELWFGEYDEDVIEALGERNKTKYNGNLVIKNSRLVSYDKEKC